MAVTAVLNAADMSLAGKANTKKEIAAIVGDTPDNFVLVTRKDFVASEQYASFDEMLGKPRAEKAEKPAASARPGVTPLEGSYHLIKPLPACADDHPKKPIWVAIESNDTVEAAKAACPEVNPPRKTNGVYTFASEFRYFLKAGYIGLGDAPEVAEGAEQGEEAIKHISHKFRSPLNIISASAQLMKCGTLTPQQQDYVERQLRAVDRMTNILDELLDSVGEPTRHSTTEQANG